MTIKSLRIPLIIVVVLGALIFVKVKFLSDAPDKAPAGGPNQKPPILSVNGIIAHTEVIDNQVFSSGTVLPYKEVDLQMETSGKITQMHIQEGRRVQQGTLLVKVNDVELRAQLGKLQTSLVLAQQKYDRAKQLLDVKGISQEDVDVLLSEISTIKSDMDVVRAQLKKTELRAPFSGAIGFRSVNEGSFITPQTKIATIQQIDPLKLDFAVPEKYSGALHVGDPVKFTIEGSAHTTNGSVYAIDPQIDVATRNIRVRAICPNAAAAIRPGSFAKVEITMSKLTDAIMIPTEAMIPVLKGYKVFISRNGVAESVPVQPGIRTDAAVQITSGISSGDTVLVSGMMMLKQGAPIRVTVRK